MNCTFDPKTYNGVAVGMFHCPECGKMVIAGIDHPDYTGIDGMKEAIHKFRSVWPNSTWQHRVVKFTDAWGEDYFTMQEVYTKKGEDKPHTTTVDANGIGIGGESVEAIRWQLEHMLEALNKPVLNIEDFENGN